MGASGSKIEEDEALNLCRERKKFVKRALNGRCSLAAAHVAYIQCLKSTGTALKKFVQPEDPLESSLYTSTSATPEPHSFFSSASASQQLNAAEHLSPCPSPPASSRFHVNHLSFSSSFTKNVEDTTSIALTGVIASFRTPQSATLQSHDDVVAPHASPLAQGEYPWDYFGLSQRENMLRKVEEIHEVEPEDEDMVSKKGGEGTQESENEFDDPSSETLVRSFENLNRGNIGISEIELLNEEILESPKLSPIRFESAEVATQIDAKMAPDLEDGIEDKVDPKDFFVSMRDVEYLFGKASDCGREVPRMLEASKLHFRPIIHGREKGSRASMLLKAFFSCGENSSQVPEDPARSPTKYLTGHQTTSPHPSSSRILLGANSRDGIDDLISGDPFERSCMISGSHVSTLDRLYAWERKLYDEVKASQAVRRQYDIKCKVLTEQESSAASSKKIDKTRAIIKDLHSRIGVAIYRIRLVSEKIEELRDNELQPQLEELIEGLSRMWESMFDCHKLQLHILTTAHSNINSGASVHSELHRHFTLVLENELNNLSSCFTKWVSAQKSYVQAIDSWLHKCVILPHSKSSRRKRQAMLPPLRDSGGPSIYTVSGVWLESLNSLPVKEFVDTSKGLAAETARFLPPKGALEGENEHVFNDWNGGYDHFRASLVIFVSQLSGFAENSVKMYRDLRKSIQEAKTNYEQLMSEP